MKAIAGRDLSEVITKIQALIPAGNPLSGQLEHVKKDLYYKSPEAMKLEWKEVGEILLSTAPVTEVWVTVVASPIGTEKRVAPLRLLIVTRRTS